MVIITRYKREIAEAEHFYCIIGQPSPETGSSPKGATGGDKLHERAVACMAARHPDLDWELNRDLPFPMGKSDGIGATPGVFGVKLSVHQYRS